MSLLGLDGQGTQMFSIGVVNNRSYEPILNSNAKGKVGSPVLFDVIAFPGGVDLRNPI